MFYERPFALLRQQPEKHKQNVDVAPPPGKISADAYGRTVFKSELILMLRVF